MTIRAKRIKFPGIYPRPTNDRFRVMVSVEDSTIYLGDFKHQGDAFVAYNAFLHKLYGPNALALRWMEPRRRRRKRFLDKKRKRKKEEQNNGDKESNC